MTSLFDVNKEEYAHLLTLEIEHRASDYHLLSTITENTQLLEPGGQWPLAMFHMFHSRICLNKIQHTENWRPVAKIDWNQPPVWPVFSENMRYLLAVLAGRPPAFRNFQKNEF